MAKLAKADIGKVRLGFAAGRNERAVAEHIEQHYDRKALAQGLADELRSMPLLVVTDGNPFAFELLEKSEQTSAPANYYMGSDRGASVYPELSVDVQPDPMPASGVDPDMDLSIVASGVRLKVVRGATHPCTPTLQEPLRESAKSTTCARQLKVAMGESQRLLRPPTQLESLREKAGVAFSADAQSAARAGGPAMGSLRGTLIQEQRRRARERVEKE